MHQIRFRGFAQSLYISSLGFILMCLSIVTFLSVTAWRLVTRADEAILPLIISGVCVLVFGLIYLLPAGKCHCQLCQAPIMKSQKCNRNREVRRFLGSFRLRLAFTYIFTGNFRCTYCGEPFTSRAPRKQSTQPVATEQATNESQQMRRPKSLPERRNR